MAYLGQWGTTAPAWKISSQQLPMPGKFGRRSARVVPAPYSLLLCSKSKPIGRGENRGTDAHESTPYGWDDFPWLETDQRCGGNSCASVGPATVSPGGWTPRRVQSCRARTSNGRLSRSADLPSGSTHTDVRLAMPLSHMRTTPRCKRGRSWSGEHWPQRKPMWNASRVIVSQLRRRFRTHQCRSGGATLHHMNSSAASKKDQTAVGSPVAPSLGIRRPLDGSAKPLPCDQCP